MKKIFLINIICLYAFAAQAQIPQPDPDTTAKHFLIVASIGNLHEISDGGQAVQKAGHAAVRSFGQMMIKDHGQAEQQLMALAKQQHIDLPPEATSGIQLDLNLKNATDNFDKLYVHAMVSGHGGTVQMFEAYTVNGKNPEVKAFAQQMLPTLKAHLAAITAIEKQMNTN
jgi:putative membrane protein